MRFVSVHGNGAVSVLVVFVFRWPGYPWIHLGDRETCRRGEWENSYFIDVALIPTMIKMNHIVKGNFRSLLSESLI